MTTRATNPIEKAGLSETVRLVVLVEEHALCSSTQLDTVNGSATDAVASPATANMVRAIENSADQETKFCCRL